MAFVELCEDLADLEPLTPCHGHGGLTAGSQPLPCVEGCPPSLPGWAEVTGGSKDRWRTKWPCGGSGLRPLRPPWQGHPFPQAHWMQPLGRGVETVGPAPSPAWGPMALD